jgi:hypothetical protein
MRLDESAVALFGKLVVDELMRHRHVVQPRRELPERIRQLRRLKNEQGANHLQPGRPCFTPRAYHNVAGLESKA